MESCCIVKWSTFITILHLQAVFILARTSDLFKTYFAFDVSFYIYCIYIVYIYLYIFFC